MCYHVHKRFWPNRDLLRPLAQPSAGLFLVMPLTPAYAWSENDTTVRIAIQNVPIKDQSQIFCSDRVVKLNAAPYLLLLDLKDTIDDDHSTATVSGGRDISQQLVKSRPGIWGSLVAEGNKAAIKQQREESIQRAHQKQIAAQQERLARKQKEEKVAVDRQIAEEKSQRARLDSLKEQELQDQRQQLQDWKQQLPHNQEQHLHPEQQHITTNNGLGDESDYEEDLPAAEADSAGPQAARSANRQPALPDHPDYNGRGWRYNNTKEAPTAIADSTSSNSNQQGQNGSQNIVSLTASSGGSRQPGVLQSLITAVAGTDGHDISSCHDPGNAAKSPRDDELLLTVVQSSRSNSSSLQQSQEQQAIQPTTPPARPQAPVRCSAAPVAVAFTQLQTSHLPAREQREIEIKGIKRQAKGDSVDVSDRQPAFLKDKGDALAGQGNYRGAINAYTRALELDPNQPALWSNRAACHLALGAAADCETDCTAAVQLLQVMHDKLVTAGSAAGEDQEVLAGLLPPAAAGTAADGVPSDSSAAAAAVLEGAQPNGNGDVVCVEDDVRDPNNSSATAAAARQLSAGSSSQTALQKVVQQLVKVLSRRAAARVELQMMQEANDDVQQALKLAPDNLQLKADALEIAAALDPAAAAQPSSIKQRADARFKAGDLQGAIEAYTSLMDMLKQQQHQAEQQQQQQRQEEGTAGADNLQGIGAMSSQQGHDQQQQLLLAAFSNRAACWLSLEQYQACVNDCSAALQLALNSATAVDTVGCVVDGSNDQCSSSRGTPAVEKDAAAGSIHPSVEPVAASIHVQPEAGSLSHAMQLLGSQLPQQVLTEAGPARVRSIARLLGRAAVACGCLKQLQHAIQLYDCAQGYWQVVGDAERAEALEVDKQGLQQMLGGSTL